MAPNVLPTAISLVTDISLEQNTENRCENINAPHASKKLDETAITKSERNDNVRSGDIPRLDIDKRQDKSGEGESRESERRWVGEFVGRWPVQTGLELSSKGLKAEIWVVGRNVGQRVATVVVWCALLGDCAIVGVVNSRCAVRGLLQAWSPLRQV